MKSGPSTIHPIRDTDLKTALDHFFHWEKNRPDAVFLRQPFGSQWRTLTWKEAGQMARKVTAALQSMGLQPGDHVGIISKNCYHWVLADLAIMMGGFISVPLYPNLTAFQLAEVLALGDVRILFAGKLDNWRDMKAGVPEHIPVISFPQYEGNDQVDATLSWDDLTAGRETPVPFFRPGLHDLWTILFTSGTTGSPKGVMLSYYAPAALLHNEILHNNLQLFEGKEFRFFSYLPLNHIAERIIVEMACIATGGTISFAESLDTFAKNLQETRPTIFMAVPRIWTKFQLAILERLPARRLERLLRIPVLSALIKRKIHKGLGLDKARILLTGAAPTPDTIKDWYARLGMPLQEVYAMTENCGGCTLMPRKNIKPGTVGLALPNVEVRIDESTGEVLMKAPWLMQGYYKQPEKTAEVLRDGWLHTGDQGALGEDRFLRLTGRVSDTFKSDKGKYIVPGPIEWGFAKNSFIEQICVVGLSIPQPLALVCLSEIGKSAPREKIEESLTESLIEVNARLPNYEQVKSIVVMKEDWNVDNNLLTPTLKIRREELNKQYKDLFNHWYQRKERIVWD